MRVRLIITILFVLAIGCSRQRSAELTAGQKEEIRREILNQIDSMNRAYESSDPDRTFSLFLHTNELAVANRGTILNDDNAVLDTLRVLLANIHKQKITTKIVKVYVINRDAAVVTAAFTADYQFKKGNELKNHPYALTILYVRTDDGWKIAHYHN